MQFKAFGADDTLQEDWTVYSIGGGALSEGPGKDLPSLYKETSAGGLAMQYRNNNVIPTGLEFQED